ncbi:sensor histidine kinase [Paenibacillus daejeonensis]|uniref:sensor histidine kinase n=1 Tax=Paenibacillus daejeonensis TaxID=135193 RepID=UPI00039BDEE0|nr:sensor histidine kinase [Paenibacillus daejeonensis]
MKRLVNGRDTGQSIFFDILVFFSYFFYESLINSDGFPILLRLLIVGLVFSCYFIMRRHNNWRLLGAFLFSCVLLPVAAIYGSEWFLYYGFIFANLLGRTSRKGYIAVGMTGIVAMFLFYILQSGERDWSLVVVLLAQLGMPLFAYARHQAARLTLELDEARIRLAQEDERHRIARDLHDTIGQTLTMIKLKGELAKRLVDKDTTQAKGELDEIVETSREALGQVRELVSGMTRVTLQVELGSAQEALSRAGIALDIKPGLMTLPGGGDAVVPGSPFEADPGLRFASPTVESFVALSLREAITNVIRHSGASQCHIDWQQQGSEVELSIRDNGSGAWGNSAGNGLRSINERMALIQGEMIWSLKPGQGSTLMLRFPLHGEKSKGVGA